jgi:hypothetical protein
MDPEVPEVFYFVSQKLGQVINYASDCPCRDPSHLRDQCPNPKLCTRFATSRSCRSLLTDPSAREGTDNDLLEAPRIVSDAHTIIAQEL